MDERSGGEQAGDERSGLGSEPRGPEFAPWDDRPNPSHLRTPPLPTSITPPIRMVQPARAQVVAASEVTLRPRADPWPTVLTVLAVLVVGIIVLVSSVLAGPEEVRPTATRVAAPVSATPTRADRMDFVSGDGDGVLSIAGRRWTTSGVRPPATGTYLHVEVELECTAGQVFYGPENFSVFDAAGELFEATTNGRSGTPLGYGTLWAGESVRGTIAFDLPRGEVTLLMSDSSSRSVTALKIPD